MYVKEQQKKFLGLKCLFFLSSFGKALFMQNYTKSYDRRFKKYNNIENSFSNHQKKRTELGLTLSALLAINYLKYFFVNNNNIK